MSHYYQDPSYDDHAHEYADDGNYGDDNYEYDTYESYPDYSEPDQWETEPTPSESEHHNHEYDDHEFVHEVPQYEIAGEEHEHWELNSADGVYENEEAGYEPEEIEYEGDRVYEQEELEYEGDEVRQQEEMEYEHGELEYHNTGMDNGVYEPQGPRYDNDEALELTELENMYEKWGHEPPAALYNERDTHAHAPATPFPRCVPMYYDDDRYAPTPTNPHSHPPHPLPSTCPPYTHPSLDASKSRDQVEPGDRAHTPSLYSNLDNLRHNYNLGIPSAVAYMQKLQEYTEECLREQDEWNADRRAEIHQNHNIIYPKRDDLAIPRSWGAINEPGHGLPHTIEESRPLGHGPKRRRYKNTRTPRYRISQPRPPLVPRPPLELDDDIVPGIAPSPNTCGNRHYSNNHTPKPPHNVNADTTPYPTSRLHPPPWPNENSNKKRNTPHNINANTTPYFAS